MKRSHFNLSWFGLLVICLGFLSSSSAQGDLLIFPKRVLFEEGKKIEIINLTNISSDTVKYTISFVQFRMDDNGKLERISEPDPGQFFADTFLRYYPRTVTLGPNESQVVKLQLRKTSSLLPGEYRSHLYFRAEIPVAPLGEANASADTSSVSVRLIPVFGMTVPCIIRIGESSTDVKISNLTFIKGQDAKPQIHVEFNRNGNFSSYGDLVVNYISPSGSTIQVGHVRGIGIYTPGTIRRFAIALEENNAMDFTKGELNVVYTSNTNKSEVLASATLSLPDVMKISAH